MIQTRLLSQHDQNISTSYKRATSKVNQAGDFRIERLFSIASKNENHHQVNISFKVVKKGQCYVFVWRSPYLCTCSICAYTRSLTLTRADTDTTRAEIG